MLQKGLHSCSFDVFAINPGFTRMRDEYLKQALEVIKDPNILINVVSRRVKQLRWGSKPLVESLEKLEPEDIALREVIEGKITYELWQNDALTNEEQPA